MINNFITDQEIVRKVRRKGGMVRICEAKEMGIPLHRIYALRDKEKLVLVNRGLYRVADSMVTEHYDLITVAKRIPQAVICLISALSFHELTTQIPHKVYLALPGPGEIIATPKDYKNPAIEVFRFSGKAFNEGIEEHKEGGVKIKVYSEAKTVADCFKFRHRVGLDVCLEALKLYRQSKNFQLDQLRYFAQICRVEKIIKPYLEIIL